MEAPGSDVHDLIADGEDLIAGRGVDDLHTGERSERGKDRSSWAEPCTWSAKALGGTIQGDGGVDVAAEGVARAVIGKVREGYVGIFGVGKALIFNAEVPIGWGIARRGVVVAANEEHVDRGVGRTPVSEGGHGLINTAGAGVDEIAEDDQTRGLGLTDKHIEACEIGGCCGLGNRDARGAIGRGLPEVHVGDAECAPARPPKGALREHMPEFTGPATFDHADGPFRSWSVKRGGLASPA